MTRKYRLFTEVEGTKEIIEVTAKDSWHMQDKLDLEMMKPGREDCWVEDYNGPIDD